MDPREIRSRASVDALFALLQRIVDSPKEFIQNTAVRTAVATQYGLAKFADPTLGIYGVSVNTLKRICLDSYPGGWEAFESKRKTVADLLAKSSSSASTLPEATASTSLPDEDTGRAAIALVRRSNLLLLNAVFQAISDIEELAKPQSDTRRKILAKEAIDRIRVGLQTNPPPFNAAVARLQIVSKSEGH